MVVINLLLSSLLIINYELALAYIGIIRKLKDILIPSIILATIAFISKIVFFAPPVIHTVILVLSCGLLLHYINKVDFLLSIIGSLLSFMTLTFGSLLVVCPLLVCFSFNIPKPNEVSGIQWFALVIMEFFIPALVLIVLRVKKYQL